MMHCYEDDQYVDMKKDEGYARLIIEQNFCVVKESEKYIRYLQEYLQSVTQALPTSSTRISKIQIGLL
jgi:hypothetical protein